MQRYEGASTIYGPYTLPGYIQEFNKLAVALAKVSQHLICFNSNINTHAFVVNRGNQSVLVLSLPTYWMKQSP